MKRIIANATGNRIIPGHAIDGIIASIPCEIISSATAAQRVVSRAG